MVKKLAEQKQTCRYSRLFRFCTVKGTRILHCFIALFHVMNLAESLNCQLILLLLCFIIYFL